MTNRARLRTRLVHDKLSIYRYNPGPKLFGNRYYCVQMYAVKTALRVPNSLPLPTPSSLIKKKTAAFPVARTFMNIAKRE